MTIEVVEESGVSVDPDQEAFLEKYADIADEMVASGKWYYIDNSYKGSLDNNSNKAEFAGIATPKHLGLGRSDYYDRFLNEMSTAAGHRVHQSDYMMWIRPTDPYSSLNFYIDTAEYIEFSLEGISCDDIRKALIPGRRAADRREIDTRYMTLWEINQVVFSEALHITTWHLRDNLYEDEVFEAFGGRVNRDRIVRDITPQRRILVPPGYAPTENRPLIFLCGPLHGSPDWQSEAAVMIQEKCPRTAIASPRRVLRNLPFEEPYRQSDYVFTRQRAWERHYLEKAASYGSILFWLPNAYAERSTPSITYGATTRFELGEWLTRVSLNPDIALEVGGEEGFDTIHTISYDMQRLAPQLKFHTVLEDLVDSAIDRARRRHIFSTFKEDCIGDIVDLIPVD